MADKSKLHVAVFPWLAFGHIIPFLELSKLLAQKGHRITFISTPRNIDRLPKIPPNLAASITLLRIPFTDADGLPRNAEATSDIRTAKEMCFLKKAFDGMETGLTRFLEDSIPDWIIHDFAPHWLQPVATRLGISTSYFNIISPWSLGFFGPADMLANGTDERSKLEDFLVTPKWVPFATKVAYKMHEVNWMLGAVSENVSGVSDAYRLGKVTMSCDLVIQRSCNEFEGKWIQLLNVIYPCPVVGVGLMPPQLEDGSHDSNEAWLSIKQWLDNQSKGSVVYVALGSEVAPSRNDISELALGLELSMVPFFWVLRKPPGSDDSGSVDLPDGFEERVKGRGIVWKSWAPQMKILTHDSIGGFLTHCGWGSVVEGITFGHPLVMLPFLVDQGLNARVLEDQQVGLEVPRDENDGSYTRNSVAESVKLVMAEDEGKKFRDKAKELSAVFGNKELQDGYLHKFVEYLVEKRQKYKG